MLFILIYYMISMIFDIYDYNDHDFKLIYSLKV